MSRGGTRPGAGRKKGSPNKATAEFREAAAQEGILPLDHMLNVLRDTDQPPERRDWAAEKAAPYLHPKLSSVEVAGKGGGPIQVNIAGDDAGLL